jgi:uncharacterized protein (TIGR03083 family)
MTTLEREPRHIAYRTARRNITDLAQRSPGAAGLTVPACPQWTVRDLVAHVAGHCLHRVGDTVGDTDELGDVLDRWERAATKVEPRIADGSDNVSLLLMDTFTHELDLRAALGVAGPADHPAYPWGFDVVVGGLAWSFESRGLPAVRLVGEDESWVAGTGEPAANVHATRHELYRSLTGRRTAAQIAALQWSGDPSRWLAAFFWGPFSQPTQPGN